MVEEESTCNYDTPPELRTATERIMEALEVYNDFSEHLTPDRDIENAKKSTNIFKTTTNLMDTVHPPHRTPQCPTKNADKNTTPTRVHPPDFPVEWCPVGSPSSRHRNTRGRTARKSQYCAPTGTAARPKSIVAVMPKTAAVDIPSPSPVINMSPKFDKLHRSATAEDLERRNEEVLQYLHFKPDAKESLEAMLDQKPPPSDAVSKFTTAVHELISGNRHAQNALRTKVQRDQELETKHDDFRRKMWNQRTKRLDRKLMAPCLSKEEKRRLEEITRPTTAPTKKLERGSWKVPMKAEGRPPSYASSVFRPSANLDTIQHEETREIKRGRLATGLSLTQKRPSTVGTSARRRSIDERPGTPPRGQGLGVSLERRAGTPNLTRNVTSRLGTSRGHMARDLDFRCPTAESDCAEISRKLSESKFTHGMLSDTVRSGSAQSERRHITERYELAEFASRTGFRGPGSRPSTRDSMPLPRQRTPPRRLMRPSTQEGRPRPHMPLSRASAARPNSTRTTRPRPRTVDPEAVAPLAHDLSGLDASHRISKLADIGRLSYKVSARKYLSNNKAGTVASTIDASTLPRSDAAHQINAAATQLAQRLNKTRPKSVQTARPKLYEPVWDGGRSRSRGSGSRLELGRWKVLAE
ncbi:hypothetical protein J8273_3965 [Carpediemonas membranifera]|uniref:Uncharacterized protein n=1 Tax=Carpediemonas membranifera TaxID=201153 RepID=A0A8J6E2H7_9EUKA|nr:hypothetical protein J8273_3965 [Carpediemonas membranifera]|eukprot:KAG9394331.1 hypothetical protein J8273_3965 [Carpediemonas membranifera]